MNRRTTYLLLAALVILLGLWGVQRLQQRQRQVNSLSGKPFAAGLPWDTINRIEMTRPTGNLIVEQRGGAWVILDADRVLPAEATALEQLKNALGRATITAIAANTQENLAQFGLDEASRTVVRLHAAGSTVAEYRVGRSTEDSLLHYLVRQGDPRVYLVSGLASPSIRADWRELDALEFDTTAATAVQYTLPRGSFSLAKDAQGAWAVDGKTGEPSKITDLVRTLSAVRALDLPSSYATFTPSGISLQVAVATSTVGLTLGPTTRDGSVIVKNYAGYVYLLSKDVKEHILPTKQSLLR